MILFTSCFLKHNLFIIYLKQSKLCFILFYRHWLWLEIGDYPNLRCTCILMKIVYCVLIQGQGNAHLYHTEVIIASRCGSFFNCHALHFGIYVMWLVIGDWPNFRCTWILMRRVYYMIIQWQGNAHLYHTEVNSDARCGFFFNCHALHFGLYM